MRKTFPVTFWLCDKLGLTNFKLSTQIQDFIYLFLEYFYKSFKVHESAHHVLHALEYWILALLTKLSDEKFQLLEPFISTKSQTLSQNSESQTWVILQGQNKKIVVRQPYYFSFMTGIAFWPMYSIYL